MKKLFCLSIILLSMLSVNYTNHIFAQVNNVDFKQAVSEKDTCPLGKNFWIIYDNYCPYCRSATKHIQDLDWERKFRFISYRDPMTYKMFPLLKKEECEKDVHMVTPKGEVLVGYKVFRTVIDNLTATKLLNPLLKNDFAEKELNEIYEKMVKKRTCYYSKTDACELNQKEKKEEIEMH